MAINFPATPTLNQTYTFNGRTWTYNNVGWQATGSTGLTVYTKTNFTATAAQTTFSVTYTVGFVDVYYNGSKLSSSEYTATTGSTVVLGTACALNDIVETIAWTISSSFNPSLGSASATSLALGGATIGSNALAVTGTTALSGLLTAAGGVSSTLVTDATSATTGSIITAGGISCQKAAVVGTNLGVGAAASSAWALGAYAQVASTGYGLFSSASTRADAASARIGAFTADYLTNTATYQTIGVIECFTQPSGTANKRGGYWSFKLQPDNTVGPSEYMQLTTTGLGIGCTPTNTLDVSRATVGTYFTGNGGDNSARALAFTSSTTTNSGDTHTINAKSGTGILAFAISSTEVARIDTSGNLLVGITSGGRTTIRKNVSQDAGTPILQVDPAASVGVFYVCGTSVSAWNGANSAVFVPKDAGTSRSINAGGTINASGADYAEYMLKADSCGVLAKGAVAGVNADGKLTDKFADAHSFVIKSTDPSYVGGDTWGTEELLGKSPKHEGQLEDETEEQHQGRIVAFEAALEAARQFVDRIAFSGQVPVNVTGATVGDYIVPVAGPDGGIAGEAVTNPTFDQYRAAVGRVWKILEDGRAFVSVKVS